MKRILSVLGSSLILLAFGCGDVRNLRQPPTLGTTQSPVLGDPQSGVVDLGDGTPSSNENLSEFLMGVRDGQKIKGTKTVLWGTVPVNIDAVESFTLTVQALALGDQGTKPLTSVQENLDLAIIRKSGVIYRHVNTSSSILTVTNGKGSLMVTATFPKGDEWEESEDLIVSLSKPDSDYSDNVDDSIYVQYIVKQNTASTALF